jgi:hypothetical protein
MATRLEISDLSAISSLTGFVVLAMTKGEVRELLDCIGELPQHFDDLVGTLDDAMAAASDEKPEVVVLRIA